MVVLPGDQIHPTEAQEEKEERGVKEEEIVQAPAPEAEVKDMWQPERSESNLCCRSVQCGAALQRLDQPDRDMTHMIQNLEECLLQAAGGKQRSKIVSCQ